MLSFRIDATRTEQRHLEIHLTLPTEALASATGQIELFLPTWTPGSYLLREYAQHLSQPAARDADSDRPLACEKVTKNRFVVHVDGADRIEVCYRVYAHDLTVRTADVDAHHAYWNHACLLLWPVDARELAAEITVRYPSRWTLACSLAGATDREHAERTEANAATDETSVTLRAGDLDEALDAPVLIGDLQLRTFEIDEVPHAIALDGLAGIEPPATLVDDLSRIVRTAHAVFGGELPYSHYTFLSLFAGEGYGGLEHRESSTLLMSRTAWLGDSGYREFLALAAHELFHAWNVKRMRPVEFWQYDYERENYTRLLWLIEGWTSYYDDLIVARAGLMKPTEYLAAMAKNIQAMLAAPGRLQSSLEESSFDAWIRLYRPNENTRNSSQNYYGNGAIAAMCLDFAVRRASDGARSLDDVARALYRSTFDEQRGYAMTDVERAVVETAGEAQADLLRELVTGAFEPDLEAVLATAGVNMQRRDAERPWLGVVFRAGSTVLASVHELGPAFAAGLAPGDELLGVADLRVTAESWQSIWKAVARIDRAVEVLVARRGVLRRISVRPTAGLGTIALTIADDATEAQRTFRRDWLHLGE